MKLIIIVLILIGSIHYPAISGPEVDDIIMSGRELDYKIYNQSTSIDTFYNNIRYLLRLDSMSSRRLPTGRHPDRDILQALINGELSVKGPVKDEGKAYQYYLKAYSNSIAKNNKVLICESIKKLLAYQIFTNNNKATFYEYLAEHKTYAYDRLELIYNAYYRLRGLIQFGYDDGISVNIPASVWQDLITECQQAEYHRIETSLWAIYAVYLEIHEKDFHLAKEAYEQTINAAQKVNVMVFENMQFSSTANLGALYLNLGDNAKALEYLSKAKSLKLAKQRPRNLIYIYQWLAEAYREMGEVDSAYYYLNRGFTTSKDLDLQQQMIAVNEIQEKYQNETLKLDLVVNELQRSRYYLLVWLFGGLFCVGTLIYFFYARISRLNSMNLQQRFVNLEKESLLKAVNAKINGEEEERRRVASILHDNISTHLAASRLHLKVLKKRFASKGESFDKTDRLLSEISTKIRKLSHELYPPALYQLGLIPALESLCEKYHNDQLQFELIADDLSDYLSKEKSIKLYFILQELLNNVIKHSKATFCKLKLHENKKMMLFEISDNGIGGVVLADNSPNSLGIYSVQARIEDMGGAFTIKSPPTSGTVIQLSIPKTEL